MMIDRNTTFGNFKYHNMKSSNSAGYWTLPYHDDGVDTLVVTEVSGASKTHEQIRSQPPGPPVEVLTTTVSNVSECLVSET